ncbi:hypothetical protein [Marinomonas sp. BSi20584]|uniref:hypothetical protein n=1 Tax=Marinomonas sp. BSi20584 TaxID=1594462 RepID=UPI000C1F6956|nr:hypothetical protein [Marinomonas sp. BSi20584]PJE55627.1 hypothetical protein TY87_09170 [Marinomonas sp. BSi20584]
MANKSRFLSAEINLSDVFKTESTKCPTCGGDAVERAGHLEACVQDAETLSIKMHAVEKTIKAFYLALDRGENALIYQNKAFRAIEALLGVQWERGAMTEHLSKHPKLKEMYEQQLKKLGH